MNTLCRADQKSGAILFRNIIIEVLGSKSSDTGSRQMPTHA